MDMLIATPCFCARRHLRLLRCRWRL